METDSLKKALFGTVIVFMFIFTVFSLFAILNYSFLEYIEFVLSIPPLLCLLGLCVVVLALNLFKKKE